jgi:hypothetical protein
MVWVPVCVYVLFRKNLREKWARGAPSGHQERHWTGKVDEIPLMSLVKATYQVLQNIIKSGQLSIWCIPGITLRNLLCCQSRHPVTEAHSSEFCKILLWSSCDRSVGIVCLRPKTTEFRFVLLLWSNLCLACNSRLSSNHHANCYFSILLYFAILD